MGGELIINNLTISYRKKKAVEDASLTISGGQLTGIIGPNGAGKSTFLKGMLGLIQRDRGETTYKGNAVEEQLKRFAYVEQRQGIDLSFPIDVFGVVLLGTYPRLGLFKRPGKKEKEIAWRCLEKVGMSEFAQQQIGELSGGQLQRVFIARALAQEAEWLFLDEPFAGIDATSETMIIQLLKQLRDEGVSIVIVHHDLHKVREYFDQLIVMNTQVIASGAVNDVFVQEVMSKAYGDEISDLLRIGGK